jgi:hypothetical protein
MKPFAVLFVMMWVVSLQAACGPTSAARVSREAANVERRVLTGWGGGRPESVVPKAAAVGFAELVVHHDNADQFARYIALGKEHGIDIYAWMYLGDIPAWRHAFPDVEPPMQVMTEAEDAALARIAADTSFGKSGYQVGGEPIGELEVLETPLLCFHDPRVAQAFEKQIDEILSIPGVTGVAFDYFGYRNYRCCHCETSRAQLAAFRREHPDLSSEQSLARHSLETLVAFNNRLSAYARSVKPSARVITHIYPVYLPEPLYGNRLDLDVCAQTAAWYFEPFWSAEKITAYARTIARDANRYYARPRGAAFVGYMNRADMFPVKSPARLTAELQAVLDAGCTRVHVCSFNAVLDTPQVAEVFHRFFAESSGRGK